MLDGMVIRYGVWGIQESITLFLESYHLMHVE